MKKFNEFNESIRDKMTSITDDDLKKRLGEEKYNEYNKLLDVRETFNKRPFLPSEIDTKIEPMILKVYSEFNTFNIRYVDGKYTLETFGLNSYKLNNLNDLIKKIKNISFDDLREFVKSKNKEIDKLNKDIEDMEKDFSYINKNF
jgi:hypothetical protein